MKVDSVGNGRYRFNFGGGPETIVLDGTDQPGNYGTTLAVTKQESNKWIVTRKQNGKIALTGVWTLSADTNVLADHFTGFNADGSTYVLGYHYLRKGSGSGFSGEWVSKDETSSKPVFLQVHARLGGLSFSYPSTQKECAARIDGKDHENTSRNAQAGSACSLLKLDERTLRLTYKIGGTLIYQQTIELSPDLKSLTLIRHIPDESETNVQVFEKN